METPRLEDKSRLLPMEPLKRRECGQPLVSFSSASQPIPATPRHQHRNSINNSASQSHTDIMNSRIYSTTSVFATDFIWIGPHIYLSSNYACRSFQMLLLALNKKMLLSHLYTYIHSFIGNIKSEINLHFEICVYIRVRGILFSFIWCQPLYMGVTSILRRKGQLWIKCSCK